MLEYVFLFKKKTLMNQGIRCVTMRLILFRSQHSNVQWDDLHLIHFWLSTVFRKKGFLEWIRGSGGPEGVSDPPLCYNNFLFWYLIVLLTRRPWGRLLCDKVFTIIKKSLHCTHTYIRIYNQNYNAYKMYVPYPMHLISQHHVP